MGMWAIGMIDGLLQPALMSQSMLTIWSVECLPKIKFLVSKGGNYLGWVVFEIVRSLAWGKLDRYIEGGRGGEVAIDGIHFGEGISDAS